MPAFDLKTEMVNQHNVAYPSPSDATKKLTLGEVCADALAMPIPNDNDGPKKRRKGELSVRIGIALRDGDGQMHLTSEEIVMIKDMVALAYSPVLVYRITEILDPPAAPSKSQSH